MGWFIISSVELATSVVDVGTFTSFVVVNSAISEIENNKTTNFFMKIASQ
jgi:hypothetical protein